MRGRRGFLAAALLWAAGCAERNNGQGTMTDLKKAIDTNEPSAEFSLGKIHWHLMRVPAGEFEMGSPPGEPGRVAGELLPRRVKLTRNFYLGRYEITQAQYHEVMGENPSKFKGDDLPVHEIRYTDALEYCKRLSTIAGAEVTLPTEAQWEYACRAGAPLPELDSIAWYRGNSAGTVHPVGQKAPNAWGLFDMLGNLFEPCIDYIMKPESLPLENPVGQRFPTHGAARGGSWMEPAERCRPGFRIQTDNMFGGIGIRIAINT